MKGIIRLAQFNKNDEHNKTYWHDISTLFHRRIILPYSHTSNGTLLTVDRSYRDIIVNDRSTDVNIIR